MVAAPQNLLIIMSDEHNPKIAGYAGHRIVSTPALDTLAAGGCCFTSAYTPSPICVPARASLATGLPVHRHRAWDNATAYDGRIPGWAHVLRNRGHDVAAIGKLHYRGHPDEDYGFPRACWRCTSPAVSAMSPTWCATLTTSAPRGRTSSPQPAPGEQLHLV